MTATEHEVGKCDICHKDYTGEFPYHGYIGKGPDGGISIVRYCNECWSKESTEE